MSINIEFPSNAKMVFKAMASAASKINDYPILIGGYIRDIIANGSSDGDIDIVLRHGKSEEFVKELQRQGASSGEMFENTGTYHLVFNDLEIEIQSANNPLVHFNIDSELNRLGVPSTWLNKNVYERDFTINTLIYDIMQKTVLDVTGFGVNDLVKDKVLRCPINSMVAIINNPIIITRAIKFAIEFDLTIDEGFLREAPKFKKSFIDRVDYRHNRHFLKAYISETFKMNFDKAYDYYGKIGFLDTLPLGDELKTNITQKRMGIEYRKPVVKKKKIDTQEDSGRKIMSNNISFNYKKEENKLYANFNLRDFSKMHKTAVLDLIQNGIVDSKTKVLFLDTPGQTITTRGLFNSGIRHFAITIEPHLYDSIKGHQEYKQRKRKETKKKTLDLFNVMEKIKKTFGDKEKDNGKKEVVKKQRSKQ